MAVTTSQYFTTVSQTAPGSQVWTNITGMLNLAGQASMFFNNGLDSLTAEMNAPLSGPEVPVDAVITGIRIQIRAYRQDAAPGNSAYPGNAAIAGGTPKSDTNDIGITETTRTYQGDLAYWGITNQQALDFAAGTEDFTFQWIENGGSINFDTYTLWVDCQFTYVSDLIPLPTLF